MKDRSNTKLKHMAYLHVVGMNTLQNDLLLSFIKDQTGLDGQCSTNLKLINNDNSLPKFLLLDCKGISADQLWEQINSFKKLQKEHYFIALCNVDPELCIEKEALAYHINGIFYKNDPLQHIPKGISTILEGELWYSRKALKKCLLTKNPSMSILRQSVDIGLTVREREVLILLASGYSNRTIAEKLFVSHHTVKTHIYNVYKKIGVDNRFQASLWAAKYLNKE